jgi:DNA-binding phage protein
MTIFVEESWMKRRRVAVWSSLLGVVTFLSACAAFEDPSKKATQNAESTALWATVTLAGSQNETIVALRSTADGAAIMVQQATQVSVERDQLRATLSAMGNPGVVNQPNIPFGSTPPTAIGGGVPAGPQPTQNTSVGQNTTVGSYRNATTGATLTDDFCAGDSVTNFAADAPVIYFVTEGQNIPAGVEFSIRITSNNAVINQDTAFWTTDDTYAATCIYYAVDNLNIPNWAAGTYLIELLANNQSVSQVTFQIAGVETGSDTMGTEETTQ